MGRKSLIPQLAYFIAKNYERFSISQLEKELKITRATLYKILNLLKKVNAIEEDLSIKELEKPPYIRALHKVYKVVKKPSLDELLDEYKSME